MDLSIVVALYNEDESLRELTQWIYTVLSGTSVSYEVIMIDDGSTDSSWKVLEELSKEYKEFRAISFRKNYGKAAALQCGFQESKGDVVITLDADLQDSPEEIPELYRMIREDGYDLVSGWKKRRHDSLFLKKIPSKFYNFTARKVTGLKLHDMNCGIKAYNSEVVKNIEVYGDMHRYIPYLAKQAGFIRIGEKIVAHQARKYGESKFGISRFFNGYLDLLTIWFLTTFGKKPMHLFGLMGTLTFLAGFIISVWLIIEKITAQSRGLKFRAVTDQPLFYLALVALIIGILLFLTGFIAEMISRSNPNRNSYQIRRKI